MILTLLALTAGLVGGYFRKGQLANIASVSPKWMILFIPALVLFVAAINGIPSYSLNLTIVALFALVVALARNVEIKGCGIIAFGLALNLVVLVLNGELPVRSAAIEAVTDGGVVDVDNLTAIEQLEDSETILPQLGDIIPIPLLNTIVSFGDLIALAGLVVLVINATLKPQPRGQISVDELFIKFGDLTELSSDIDLRDQSPVDDEPDVVVLKPTRSTTGNTVESGQH